MHQLLNSCSFFGHYSRRFSFWLFDWTLGYHWDGIVVLCFSNCLQPLFILPPSMAGVISASSRCTHTKTEATTTVISGAWNNFGTVLVTTNFWPPRSFISIRVCTLRWLSRTQWWKNQNYCIGIFIKKNIISSRADKLELLSTWIIFSSHLVIGGRDLRVISRTTWIDKNTAKRRLYEWPVATLSFDLVMTVAHFIREQEKTSIVKYHGPS